MGVSWRKMILKRNRRKILATRRVMMEVSQTTNQMETSSVAKRT